MTRIVLADDHPFVRTGVEAVLGAIGMEVVASVVDGDSALAAIAREDPDLVILDVRMPGRGGVAVLEALRGAGDHRPVILLAAEVEDSLLLAAMAAGVNGIVFKAGAEATLAEAIAAVLAGAQFIDPATTERARALAGSSPAPSPYSELTPRELQIAEGVMVGLRNREIAGQVGMTEGSIKVYLHRIYEKLGVSNRTELAIAMLAGARPSG